MKALLAFLLWVLLEPVVVTLMQAVQKRTKRLKNAQIKIVARMLIEPDANKRVLTEPFAGEKVHIESSAGGAQEGRQEQGAYAQVCPTRPAAPCLLSTRLTCSTLTLYRGEYARKSQEHLRAQTRRGRLRCVRSR